MEFVSALSTASLLVCVRGRTAWDFSGMYVRDESPIRSFVSIESSLRVGGLVGGSCSGMAFDREEWSLV